MRIILLVAGILALIGQAPPALRVTFLGTGAGPAVGPEWAGPSTLVEFGREAILIDAGRGLVQRMRLLGRPAPGINTIFLTHLHSDHTVGLPEFWLRSWGGEGCATRCARTGLIACRLRVRCIRSCAPLSWGQPARLR